MAATAQIPKGFAAAENWWRRVFEPGFEKVSGGRDLTCRTDGTMAAFTGISLSRLRGTPSTSVCLIDLASLQVRSISGNEGSSFGPSWSPSDDRLAFLSNRGSAGAFSPRVIDVADADRWRSLPIPGLTAERVEWCRDGQGLFVLAAEEGSDQPAVNGSGLARSEVERDSLSDWVPLVRRSGPELGGWRRAFIVRLEDGEVRQVSGEVTNVWEGCVAGDAILAVASRLPIEGDWFNSTLLLIPLDGSPSRQIYEPRWQLAWPAATSDGGRLAIVEGIASDRGVVAGEVLLFSRDGGGPRKLSTESVDATWLQFRDPDHLCFAGVREAETVFGEIDLSSGAVTTHLDGGFTTAGAYPSASVRPGKGLLVVGEEWQLPPFVAGVSEGDVEELASFSNSGLEWLRTQLSPMQRLSWVSSDGLRISGLLTVPPGRPGPHPTVLLIHGGPSHAWTPAWPGKTGMLMVASYLVSRGFAILLPNPRGSSGRGQEYLGLELGDYGGLEVDDNMAGLDLLIADGIADSGRLAVMGASHGGYMTCRLTTKTSRFKAGVAVSPYTDFYSQHYGGNVPEFDVQYLRADPTEPGGPYFERSPLFAAKLSSTPTLLTAGGQDRCTPAGQAVEFHQALLAAGIETELVIYPEEGHGVKSLPAEIDLAARAADFLERHLASQPNS